MSAPIELITVTNRGIDYNTLESQLRHALQRMVDNEVVYDLKGDPVGTMKLMLEYERPKDTRDMIICLATDKQAFRVWLPADETWTPWMPQDTLHDYFELNHPTLSLLSVKTTSHETSSTLGPLIMRKAILRKKD